MEDDVIELFMLSVCFEFWFEFILFDEDDFDIGLILLFKFCGSVEYGIKIIGYVMCVCKNCY